MSESRCRVVVTGDGGGEGAGEGVRDRSGVVSMTRGTLLCIGLGVYRV